MFTSNRRTGTDDGTRSADLTRVGQCGAQDVGDGDRSAEVRRPAAGGSRGKSVPHKLFPATSLPDPSRPNRHTSRQSRQHCEWIESSHHSVFLPLRFFCSILRRRKPDSMYRGCCLQITRWLFEIRRSLRCNYAFPRTPGLVHSGQWRSWDPCLRSCGFVLWLCHLSALPEESQPRLR